MTAAQSEGKWPRVSRLPARSPAGPGSSLPSDRRKTGTSARGRSRARGVLWRASRRNERSCHRDPEVGIQESSRRHKEYFLLNVAAYDRRLLAREQLASPPERTSPSGPC